MSGGAAALGDGAWRGEDAVDQLMLDHLLRFQAGDRSALADLLALVRPRLLRYARTRLGPSRDAFVSVEDVVQETCLALVKALPGYRWDGRPLMAFVYAIAGRKVIDVFRSCSRDRSDPVWEMADRPDELPDPEQRAIERERGAWAGALVATLPVKQREILYLRVMTGLSAEDTARAVGSTPGAVRVAQHRALATLRRKLGG